MPGNQVMHGKAFEYACLNEIYNFLNIDQSVSVIKDSSYYNAKNFFETLDSSTRLRMELAAKAAIRVLIRLEPLLNNSLGNTPLYLQIQEDAQGKKGDVRDILAIRRQNNWEIGISAKNNHSAVKHSRLSGTIDFGKEWLGLKCSKEYFDEIKPLFDKLNDFRQQGLKWSELPDKEGDYYIPILEAFKEELKRLSKQSVKPSIPSRLLSYLLGRNDFYKVIAHYEIETTEIQAFSLYGTLNRPAGNIQPEAHLPIVKLPNNFYNIQFKPDSNNTVLIICDEGWQISARIHNAKTEIEPSLKFDIQLIGVPTTLQRYHEPWM